MSIDAETPEELEIHFRSMMDSVTTINEAMAMDFDSEAKMMLIRNLPHLEMMLSRPHIISDERDKTVFSDAVAAGRQHLIENLFLIIQANSSSIDSEINQDITDERKQSIIENYISIEKLLLERVVVSDTRDKRSFFQSAENAHRYLVQNLSEVEMISVLKRVYAF